MPDVRLLERKESICMRKCTSAVLCAILLAACLTAGTGAVSAVVPEDGVILSDSMTGETAEASFPSDFQWNYDADTKTLTLSGTGYVNVNPLADMPWVDVNNEIEHIVLEEGITGYYQSFSGNSSAPTMYKSVKTLSLPSTLNSFSVYIPTLEKYTAAEGGCFYCADDVYTVKTRRKLCWSPIREGKAILHLLPFRRESQPFRTVVCRMSICGRFCCRIRLLHCRTVLWG